MLSLVNERYDKVLVELFTFFNGEYGRLFILVSLGVSCTTWYLFVPGVGDTAPPIDVFPRDIPREQFFNPETSKYLFKKVSFIEHTYITDEILKAFENESPFSELHIPESGYLRAAVGLGLIITTKKSD